MITKRLSFLGPVALLALIATAPLMGQNRTRFGGRYEALDYAYGQSPAGAQPAGLQILTGNAATGSQTVTVAVGFTASGDGRVFTPLATNAPILVGGGSNQETVTPSAVTCTTPALYGACTFTATFSNLHGAGDLIASASFGLQEAMNLAQGDGGGTVVVDQAWAKRGGTSSTITSASPYSNVFIEDTRNGFQYWSMQPTTLTSLAVPTTLTSTTATFTGTAGTWTNAAQFLCVTYVDAQGGEGPCSATYNATPAANTTLTITSPAASTGAVGWRAYGGATYNGAYLLPVTSSACTLATLETVIPACAIGANGVWPAIFVNTTTLRPNGQTPTVNLNLPMPQGHTTFAYEPSGSVPQAFQTNYGPFPSFGALTSGQVAVLGSVNFPAGYFNVIGRTVRVTGKIALTTLNTATLPYITLSLGWVGGTTAGAPVAVCSLVPAAAGSTATANEQFNCTMTTNAVGATAIGTVMTNGSELLVAAAGGALTGATIDTGTAAIGSLGLFAQDTLYVTYTSTTNATAGEQLLDLHIETLQ